MKARIVNRTRTPLMMMGVAMGLLTLVGAGAVHAQRAPVARGCVSVLPATVEMNTVAVGDLVKTVVMEKEVFHCFKWQSPRLPPPILPPEVVIDVQLFTELTERKVGDTFGTIEAGFHAVICKKDVAGARLEECENVRVPVLESAAVGGCVFESPSGGHPVAMTTVAIGDLVRTIKAQKEVFRCPSPAGEVFVDFTTFTEIVEKSEDDAFTQTQKRMHAAVCHKLLSNDPGGGFIKPLMPVRIAGCEDFPVSFRE